MHVDEWLCPERSYATKAISTSTAATMRITTSAELQPHVLAFETSNTLLCALPGSFTRMR